MEAKYYTGLQVSRDPGPRSWPCGRAHGRRPHHGFFHVAPAGLAQGRGKGGSCRIRLAGRSTKDPVGLDREMGRLREAIWKQAGVET
jgi:hypothetical protein